MDPFKMLNIHPDATKKEIIQAVALAMRERKYSGRELAKAQKLLFDPVSRAAQTFMHVIDVTPLKDSLSPKKPDELNFNDSSDLVYLEIFEEAS